MKSSIYILCLICLFSCRTSKDIQKNEEIHTHNIENVKYDSIMNAYRDFFHSEDMNFDIEYEEWLLSAPDSNGTQYPTIKKKGIIKGNKKVNYVYKDSTKVVVEESIKKDSVAVTARSEKSSKKVNTYYPIWFSVFMLMLVLILVFKLYQYVSNR